MYRFCAIVGLDDRESNHPQSGTVRADSATAWANLENSVDRERNETRKPTRRMIPRVVNVPSGQILGDRKNGGHQRPGEARGSRRCGTGAKSHSGKTKTSRSRRRGRRATVCADLMPPDCAPRNGEAAKFTLCAFYLNKKKKKKLGKNISICQDLWECSLVTWMKSHANTPGLCYKNPTSGKSNMEPKPMEIPIRVLCFVLVWFYGGKP